MKTCKNCIYWNAWEEKWGYCKVLNDETEIESRVYGEVEDCVPVKERNFDFALHTKENFSCIHFKK